MFGTILSFIALLAAIAVERTQKPRVPGAERRTVTVVTFDNAYPTGGEVVLPSDLGLKRLTHVEATVIAGTESAEYFASHAVYDLSTGKLKLIDDKTGKELANAKDASKVKVQVVAFGS